MTGNQIVAYNLKRIRESKGLTQEQAADLLEPYLNERWSPASFSAAERSALPDKRSREFTADDLLAFMRAFEVPLASLLMPPVPGDQTIEIGRETITPVGLVNALFPPEVVDEAQKLVRAQALASELNTLLSPSLEIALAKSARRNAKEKS